MKSQFAFLLLLATVCVGVASIGLFARADETAPAAAPPARALPVSRLFDWSRYQELFKKNYKGLSEQLARKKLFLARAFRVFLAAIGFKHHKKDYYLAINERSDWTPEEIKSSYVNYAQLRETNPELFRDRPRLDERALDSRAKEGDQAELVPVADEAEIAQALDELAKEANRTPGALEISRELSRLSDGSKSRRRRDTADDRQLTLDELISEPDQSDLSEHSDSVASNNPDYQPAELTSFGADGDKPEPLREETAGYLNLLSGRDFLSSAISGVSKLFTGSQSESAGEQTGAQTGSKAAKRTKRPPTTGNVLHVDHRESGCFFLPRSQGKCGSCYIFAAIALYEYVHCKQTKEKVALSEQYIVDCGSLNGLKGCQGGVPEYVGNFAHRYGLELRANYPYRAKQDSCPYEPGVWPKHMGYLRAEYSQLMDIQPEAIDRFLAATPVQVDFALKADFSEYGGGIDDLVGCRREDGHAMLVVGMGTENGKDYWLVRNSHGHNWGENGYYRAAKNFDCLVNRCGSVSVADVNNKPLVSANKHYDGSGAKRRYAEYMREDFERASRAKRRKTAS